MQYEKVYSFITRKLESELPVHLTYHNLQHTKSVIAAAEHLAIKEGLIGDDVILIKTAALFHDVGFLERHLDHESLGCEIAKNILPDYGYTDFHISQICEMIMATKIPQKADDKFSQIVCDADLYYLGQDNYVFFADKLFSEFKTNGIVTNNSDWLTQQIDFLKAHKYFTATAQSERNIQKQINLNNIQNKIAPKVTHSSSKSKLSWLQDAISIIAGVIISGFALKGFLVPNHFFDGGITGISLLIHEIYHFNLAIVIILFNLPLIVISYFSVGKTFAFRMFLSVILLGICLWLLPTVPMTSDKLLISIFGGAFLGIGIGLVMRAGSALDGIEVLALYTLKKTSFSITEIILGLNILIFITAAFTFGIETALYSILTYFAATRCIDYVVEGIQAYTGVTIISGKSDDIKSRLVNEMGRGITVYKGERGFLPGKFEISEETDIIFTVITRLELRKLKNVIEDTDPKAFVFASTIKEASGGVIKRLHKH